jgi:hypothetical protein
MVQEGLQGIYNLFIEKINSTFKQIFEKLFKNQKFQNAEFYFIRDFPFFYFSIKIFSLNIFEISEFNNNNNNNTLSEIEDIKTSKFSFINNYKIFGFENSNANLININDIKNIYMEKFIASVTENFSRVFYLLILQEKSLENNFGNFEVFKEILNTDNVNLHLINYIKQMSWSYIDILDEFNLHSEEQILEADFFLLELSSNFSNLLNENYFEMIYLKLDELYYELAKIEININGLNNNNNTSIIYNNNNDKVNNTNININININNDKSINKNNEYSSIAKREAYNIIIFKYFYYLNVINKMNDVLLNFNSSNIKYLITNELKHSVEKANEKYQEFIFNEFLKRVIKNAKFILINKDMESL